MINSSLYLRKQTLFFLIVVHSKNWAKSRVSIYPLPYICTCVHAKSLQSCLTLCNAMDPSPPGSSVHGTLQARILGWVAVPSSRGSAYPGIEPTSLVSPGLAGVFFTTSTTWKAPTSNKFPQFLFAWKSLCPSLLKDNFAEYRILKYSLFFFSLSIFKIFQSTFLLLAWFLRSFLI